MIILLLFAFIAGIVTVLSPCILPVLPIVLSTSTSSGVKRPLGVICGFLFSFTFFTLFLSTLVKATGISADILRLVSIVLVGSFGLSLLIPKLQEYVERWFSALARFSPSAQKTQGFAGGVLLGASLGLLWTPCVGPILASVISIALSGNVTGNAVFITFAYALGTAIPMFAIIRGGQTLLQKYPFLLQRGELIHRVFGLVMILTAIALYFNIDRTFQTYIIQTFPAYGRGLTKIEELPIIKDELRKLSEPTMNDSNAALEIHVGGQWFNTETKEGLQLKNLRGKVVLIDFWTYTCINCQRTLPYLRKWWDMYKDDNFVIIGVHSPEFEFEKNPKNLAQAIKDFNLKYPIVQDNNFATWRAFNNQYWPAKYLIDKEGKIRYSHFGEGSYDKTEQMIQTLIKETGVSVTQSVKNQEYQTKAETPETYLGADRMIGFDSPEALKNDIFSTYSFPPAIQKNTYALSGSWKITRNYAQASLGSSLMLRFKAGEVYLVMRPTSVMQDTPSPQVQVYLDGKPYAKAALHNGVISVDKDMLYHLISLEESGGHLLELRFPQGEIELYAFTFG